jgi:hypothetical protein
MSNIQAQPQQFLQAQLFTEEVEQEGLMVSNISAVCVWL